jgi:tRNA 2-thiouridine synthesizing protein A
MADTGKFTADQTLDATGTLCPIPIVWTAEHVKQLSVGQVLEVLATDEAIQDDLPAWCRATKHELLGFDNDPPLFRGYVRRAHE